MAKIVKGKAIFMYLQNDILLPCLSTIPRAMTLADAPIIVPLPPKHAPIDKAHQTGLYASTAPSEIWLTKGIIVATYGMLSKNDESIVDIHNTIIVIKPILPSVMFKTFTPIKSITPMIMEYTSGKKKL